jgi:hypothetical protein
MSLCVSDGSNCVGDGLPGPATFSAGIDPRYVVLARHPISGQGVLEQGVTEYYYIIRTADEGRGVWPGNIKGPLDQRRFEQERRRLGLPAFSITYDDLK